MEMKNPFQYSSYTKQSSSTNDSDNPADTNSSKDPGNTSADNEIDNYIELREYISSLSSATKTNNYKLPQIHPRHSNQHSKHEQQHQQPSITTHLKRETLHEFIDKKREMLFIQYAMKIKESEIEKMELKSLKEEEDLQLKEKQLEQESIKFDNYLKENDRQCAEAMKRAENETKLRLDKSSDLKRLTQQALSLKSEIIKNEDQLSDLRKYRSFILEITPKDWLPTGTNTSLSIESDDYILSEPDQLYFQNSSQLLQVFQELEEGNLALIQSIQENDETLEELKYQISEAESKYDKEVKSLLDEIQSLQNTLAREQEKMAEMEKKLRQVSSKNSKQQQQQQSSNSHSITVKDNEQLTLAVKEAYRQCIGELDSNVSVISMLTAIENKLEKLFEVIESMPPEAVVLAEKQRDKERRQRLREEKLDTQKRIQEERARKALEKALAGAEIKKRQ